MSRFKGFFKNFLGFICDLLNVFEQVYEIFSQVIFTSVHLSNWK